jgi:hypothetical protein
MEDAMTARNSFQVAAQRGFFEASRLPIAADEQGNVVAINEAWGQAVQRRLARLLEPTRARRRSRRSIQPRRATVSYLPPNTD